MSIASRALTTVPTSTELALRGETGVTRGVRDDRNPAFLTGGGGGFSLSGIGFTRDNLELYSSWSWACIDKIAEAMSSLDVTVTQSVGRTGTERKEVAEDHWLARLLADPNPEIEPSTLWSLAARWFLINGNAYLYTPTYGEKTPQEIWVLPSNRVQVVTGQGNGGLVNGYAYYHDGKPYPIDAAEMIHWRYLDPSADVRTSFVLGRSPMNAALRAIHVDVSNQEYLARYFQNDALPAFVILDPLEMAPFQFDQMKAQWNETFMGPGKAGKWGILDQGKSILPLKSGGRAEEMAILDDANRKRVCTVWGVSEMILTGDFNSRATSETVFSEFHRGTVTPKARRLAEAFTRHARRYDTTGENLRVEFNPYSYQDAGDERAERESWAKLGVPVNRLLAEAGKELLPEEEKPNELRTTVGGATALTNLLTEYGLGTIPRESAIATAVLVFGFDESEAARLFTATATPKAPAPAATLAFKASKSPVVTSDVSTGHELPDDVLRGIWKRYDDLNTSGAERIKGPLVKVTQRLEAAVLGAFDKAFTVATVSPDGETSNRLPDGQRGDIVNRDGLEVSELFDVKQWKRLYAEATSEEVRRHLLRIAAQAMRDVGADFDDMEGPFNRRLSDAMEESTAKITTTVDTAHDELTALLKEYKGRPVAETREAIRARFDHYSKAGAENVARTTSAFTTGRAQTDAWRTLEEEDDEIVRIERVWLTRRDGRVRPSHKALDGTVATDEGFEVEGVKLAHPGAGDVASSVCNCRCVLRGRVVRR